MRKSLIAMRRLLLLAVIPMLASGQAPGSPRKKLMSEMALEVRPVRTQFLTGESVLVNSFLLNQGRKPVEVPPDSNPSEITYTLRALTDGAADFEVSSKKQREARIPGTPQHPRPVPGDVLHQHERVGRMEDLTDLASRPFPPGPYELRARIFIDGAIVESLPVRIEIVVPKPDAMVTAWSVRSNQQVSALAQKTGDGWAILMEEAALRRRPDWSVWKRQRMKTAPTGPVSLAVTVDEVDYVGDRWLGWMEGSMIHASRLQPMQAEPPDVMQHSLDSGLAHAKLLSPGFQRADGGALFFAFGEGKLGAFHFTDRGAKRLWVVESAADLSAASISLAPGAFLTVVYLENNAVRYMRWSLDGKPMANASGVLFPQADGLTDLQLEPLSAAPELQITAGPGLPTTDYTVARWVLGEAPKQTVTTLPALPQPAASIKSVHWADRMDVAAGLAGGYAQMSLPADKKWTPKRPPVNLISLDRTEAQKTWLHVFQPNFGYRWISFDAPTEF